MKRRQENVTPQPDNQEKEKRGKRKKKHRFLKFLFLTALIIISYKGAQKLCDHIAEKKLYQFADKYPFEFQTDDESIGYICNDFSVPVSYEYKGKTYNVSWVSDSSCISVDDEGNAKVYPPKTRSESVTLKQEYSFLLGKAALSYNAGVITGRRQEKDEINVISINDIKNGTYPRKMKMKLNDNNKEQVRYMDGDFGDLHIYSIEDAYTVAEAYREILGIHPDITFRNASLDVGDLYSLYVLSAYWNDTAVEGSTLMFTVYRETGEVTKITNCVFEDPEQFTGEAVSGDPKEMIRKWNDENRLISEPYEVFDEKTAYVDGVLTGKSFIWSSDGGCYEAEIRENSINIHPASSSRLFEITREEALCSGQTEDGGKLDFTASSVETAGTRFYELSDITRKIQVFDNFGTWKMVRKAEKPDASIWAKILALPDLAISRGENIWIRSSENVFNDPISVEGFAYVQNVYDYYVKNFRRYSYDGNSHDIIILSNCAREEDNASWDPFLKVFCLNPPKEYRYSLSYSPEVIAHEYTHAVFESIVGSGLNYAEVKGINEGYADVFGCLAANSDDWTIASNYRLSDGMPVHLRDLLNVTTTEEGFELTDAVSSKYKDEIWNDTNCEEHAVCVLIGHVAAMMSKSKYFTKYSVGQIWYNSISAGYDNDSTFIDVRRNIIKAAEDMGTEKEALDFIAYQFDLEEIYDPSYTITTEAYITDTENSETDEDLYVTNGLALNGDLVYDDTTSRNFIYLFSAIGIKFFDQPIWILEDKTNASDEEIAEAEEVLTKKAAEIISEVEDAPDVSVKIIQLPKPTMFVLSKVCERFESEIHSFSNSDLEEVLSYGIMVESKNMTPFRFYSYIGFF